jgi:Zn-dependent protease/predicted transcriptional regulator
MRSSLWLGRIAGITIGLHWSVLFLLFLVISNLGAATFPAWHPDWSPGLVWATAAAAAVLLLVSILVHELAHAVVGRLNGIPIGSITLFAFGGVTDIEREPPSARSEGVMALVGPLTSILIGVLATAVSGAFAGWGGVISADPAAVARRMPPLITLLAWIGPVNLMLGVFNLVPAFPLDGGRVLRALLWKASGDLHQATRWASWSGRAIAVALMAVGVLMAFGARFPYFGTGVGGLWLTLIGWFLFTAAAASYRQLIVRDLLEDVPVTRLLRRIEPVSAELDLDALVFARLLPGIDPAVPVERDGRLAGIITLADVRRIPREGWAAHRVGEVMTPAERLHVLDAHADLYTTLTTMARTGVAQLPVIDDGSFLGLVTRADIARWVSVQAGGATPERRPPGGGRAPRPPVEHREQPWL